MDAAGGGGSLRLAPLLSVSEMDQRATIMVVLGLPMMVIAGLVAGSPTISSSCRMRWRCSDLSDIPAMRTPSDMDWATVMRGLSEL